MDALITNGAIATDGGSISLAGVDAEGQPLELFLDNSIASHRQGARSLSVNGKVIPSSASGSAGRPSSSSCFSTARISTR